jgi:hypothetical protein
VSRTTLGHDVDDAEDLERRDELRHADEEQVRREQRHRDPANRARRAGAVDLGRFVEILGDSLHAGKEGQHGIPRPLPHADDDDRGHRPRRTRKPRRAVDADERQYGVEQAPLGVVDPVPDVADRDDVGDVRREVGGTEQRDPPPATPVTETGIPRSRTKAGRDKTFMTTITTTRVWNPRDSA